MTERSVNITVPTGFLGFVAVLASATLFVLNVAGVIHAPWYVVLAPILFVVGISAAVVLAIVTVGLLAVLAVALIDAGQKRARQKRANVHSLDAARARRLRGTR